MGQLSSMKEIVDEKKKDNDAKESLLDKEKRGMEEKLSVQQQKISGKEMTTLKDLSDVHRANDNFISELAS